MPRRPRGIIIDPLDFALATPATRAVAGQRGPPPEAGPRRRPSGPPPLRVRVRCGGALHEIFYIPGGPLHFPDHDLKFLRGQLRRLRRGRPVCRCAAVLAAWREAVAQGGASSPLPAGLGAAARAARDVHFARLRAAWPFRDALAVPTWHERPGFLARLLTRLLRERWGLPPWVRCEVRDVRTARKADLPVYVLTLQGRGQTLLEGWVDRQWFTRLYRGTGLGLHENKLALNFYRTEATPGSPAPFACTRDWPVWGPGGELTFAHDWVALARGPDGAWQVVRGPFVPR
jgi:hypothetical protein